MFSFQWGIQVRGEIIFTGRFYQGLVHDLFFEYLKAKENIHTHSANTLIDINLYIFAYSLITQVEDELVKSREIHAQIYRYIETEAATFIR